MWKIITIKFIDSIIRLIKSIRVDCIVCVAGSVRGRSSRVVTGRALRGGRRASARCTRSCSPSFCGAWSGTSSARCLRRPSRYSAFRWRDCRNSTTSTFPFLTFVLSFSLPFFIVILFHFLYFDFSLCIHVDFSSFFTSSFFIPLSSLWYITGLWFLCKVVLFLDAHSN